MRIFDKHYNQQVLDKPKREGSSSFRVYLTCLTKRPLTDHIDQINYVLNI